MFRKIILKYLKQNHIVLEIGAGIGKVNQMNFKGLARRVCGLDPDSRIKNNTYLDEAVVGVGESIPYPDSTFDLVFANNVLEHIEQPHLFLKEIGRVLKSDGLFLAKTPNRFHYVPLIARCTPHWFHELVNRIRGRAVMDTFPTRYKLNDNASIVQSAKEAGFKIEEVNIIEGRPEYLRMTGITYLLGMLYERIVNSTNLLKFLRVLLLIELKKARK
ncbi:MAG: class I SAM-dependent methyltransferase [Syntrophorhabdaceae bacterium]